MASQPRESFFVTCAPGLEPVLHEEIKDLRLGHVERQVGGVYFEGTLRDAQRANLWLRTAVRVLMRVARFPAANADELYEGALRVDWRRFLRPEGTLVVDARSKESALDHTLFVEQRLKDAIVDTLRTSDGVRPSVVRESADLGVDVHLFRDRCTISVDTSGDSLHRRGWRSFQGRAPLAETLAAGIVMLSEWDRRAPLIDPFCGSGTVLIEAALWAGGVAPGSFRKEFGFERWPGHEAEAWRALVEKARASVRWPPKLVLRGSDRDYEAIAGARQNLAAAGLEGKVELQLAEATEFAPRKGWNAWLVSNLPYGERIGDEREARALYRRFGKWVRATCGGYHVALLVPRGGTSAELQLGDSRSIPLANGGIECELLLAQP